MPKSLRSLHCQLGLSRSLPRGRLRPVGWAKDRTIHHDSVVLHEQLLARRPIGISGNAYNPIVSCVATPHLLYHTVISLLDMVATGVPSLRAQAPPEVGIVHP